MSPESLLSPKTWDENWNKTPFTSSNRACVLSQTWLDLTCEPGRTRGPTQNFQHVLTTHSCDRPRLQRPGPLRASMQTLPTKGMGFKTGSHQQKMLRGKEK